jgi:hypothetical protein
MFGIIAKVSEVPADPNAMGPQDADAVGSFFDRLAAEDDECAVLSVLYRPTNGLLRLSHASLVVGPPRVGEVSWARWRVEHTTRLTWDFGDAKDLPPEFVYDHGTFLAGRAVLTVPRARAWLVEAATSGELPAIGPLPAAHGRFAQPDSLLRIFPRLWTPAARLAGNAIRPLSGFLFATEQHAGAQTLPSDWDVAGRRILGGAMTALGISVPDTAWTQRAPAAHGLLVGRIERRAWFNDVRGGGDYELFELHLGWEPARCDLADLEVELEEWVGDEVAYARRLALGDIQLGDRQGADTAIVSLPTLGRGVAHSARLHDRDGALLDVTNRSKLIEQASLTMQFSVAGSDDATEQTIKVGKAVTPTAAQRLERFDTVERQYRDLLEEGLAERIVTDPSTAIAVVRRQLEGARGELLVLDPYFGADPADWQVLAGISLPVRVLSGSKAQAPPTPMANVDARKLNRLRARTPGFHDRLYLWDGGGLSVGTSPSGLGKRDARLDRLGTVEAAGWRALFDAYWASGDYVPL